MKGFLMALICVGLIGIAFFSIGLIMKILRINNRKRCTAVTNGMVIKVERRVSRMNHQYRVLYHPVYSYYANGYNIEVEDPIGTNPASFSEGQVVEIHYDPYDVRKFYVGNSNLSNILSIVFMVLGAFLIAISLIFLMILK